MAKIIHESFLLSLVLPRSIFRHVSSPFDLSLSLLHFWSFRRGVYSSHARFISIHSSDVVITRAPDDFNTSSLLLPSFNRAISMNRSRDRYRATIRSAHVHATLINKNGAGRTFLRIFNFTSLNAIVRLRMLKHEAEWGWHRWQSWHAAQFDVPVADISLWILVRRLVLLRRTWKSWPLFRARCRAESVGHNNTDVGTQKKKKKKKENAMIAFPRYFCILFFFSLNTFSPKIHFRAKIRREILFIFFSSVKFIRFPKS